MMLTVQKTERLDGSITLPASKSYSIRAFIIAACGGRSRIIAPSDCDDARVAARVARHLGSSVVRRAGGVWDLQADVRPVDLERVDVGESGTVLRFLLPLLPLYTLKGTVTGQGTLRGRPNHLLTEVLRQQGVDIRGEGEKESVPITLRGGAWTPGRMTIDGSLSSQFISALLIAAPRLAKDSAVVIGGTKMVSADYIAMTREILTLSGIQIHASGPRRYRIPGGQTFRGLKTFHVPSDYGLAAFHLAAAALTPSRVTLRGHFVRSLPQADGRIMGFLERMGVSFKETSRAVTLRGPSPLRGGDFSLKDCPDLVPIMAVLALFAKGRTRLRHIAHARVKESDRISDLRRELLKAGGRVTENHQELIIDPFTADEQAAAARGLVTLDPHHDHRLAMAFCVLGLRRGGVQIKDIGCVSKSYPGFVRDLRALGGRLRSSRG